ncbi:MAG: hypothetical protein ACYC23_19155 [Limisphaerales bacterium]
MAFQGKQPFFAFLQGTADGAALEEVAPAENYVLDERVPGARENDYLSFNDFPVTLNSLTQSVFCPAWFKHCAEYAKAHVALPAVSGTFTATNRENWQDWSPDWDVVRVETLGGLNDRALNKGSHIAESKVAVLVREMLDARDAGSKLDALKQAELEKWLQLANSGRDRRPAFVAPFAEVEDILKQADWPNRLRDALGLGHIRATGNPMVVVLMQYNLIRVHNAHIGKPAWAASPTVLDDVPRQMPNPCFFPAPKTASKDGYGFTVDLATSGATWRKEFLHGHIAYTLADIRRIGEVTTDVTPNRIADARKDHRDLLASDLHHLSDLPARP